MIVVSNSGPLISLARIGHFYLLYELYDELYLPTAVREEVVSFGAGRPGVVEVENAQWIRVVNVSDRQAVDRWRENLDLGESEAIVLAMELQADWLLIDEARGRRFAKEIGLNHLGTVGTLIIAKQSGLIASITPLLDELIACDFRISQQLYRNARTLADED
ncbi:MAG: DUF3368 domain-containing protein [Okeania sp. SIO2H7]|nr:DUF3368 domain-containing protein [Okeania sp. SIO2H7]